MRSKKEKKKQDLYTSIKTTFVGQQSNYLQFEQCKQKPDLKHHTYTTSSKLNLLVQLQLHFFFFFHDFLLN